MKTQVPFKIYGIFGDPLKHSLSPVMQERAFAKRGIKAYYLKFEMSPKVFGKVMSGLSQSPVTGFNVTVPYKERVLRYLDRVTPEARRIGAVNTVYKRGGSWIGTNTDVYGFLHSLKTEGRFDPKGRTVMVLGAGGAARAVVYGLASAKAARVMILNRHVGRGRLLAREFGKLFPKIRIEARPLDAASLRVSLRESALIVNGTSAGLKAQDKPLIDLDLIPEGSARTRKLFFDLIYDPRETLFLKYARQRGHRTLNGTGMLVFQGAKAFECWTGRQAPAAEMRRALSDALKAKESGDKA